MANAKAPRRLEPVSRRWLLLVHVLPPTPSNLRVRIWRRLQQLGALAVKQSVYVLPDSPDAREDFEWLRVEIDGAGGEAAVFTADSVDAWTAEDLAKHFRRARAVRSAAGRAPAARLRDIATFQGRLWVTRPRPGVDRMASAWLIRRFIDPRARFTFAADAASAPRRSVPFDMFEGEFSHHGAACTFETLCARFALRDRSLRRLAALVHDLDLKDGQFGAPDAPTIGRLLRGIERAFTDDAVLLQQGMTIFEALYLSWSGTARSLRR